MKQITFGIREAKNKFSKLLRYSKSGQEVIITDRGIPAYKIIPVNWNNETLCSLCERVTDWESKGLLVPLCSNPVIPKPVVKHGVSIQKILQDDRDSTW